MNKAALRTQFKNLLNRNDCSNNLADTFLDQALGRIQRTLRVPNMEQIATVSFSDALPYSFILPNDFLEFIDLYYEGPSSGVALTQLPMSRFLELPSEAGSVPKYYSRVGAEVKVKPSPSQAVTLTLRYYAEIPDLIEEASTNFVTQLAPELLIYCALSFAADYFVDERKDAFEATYQRTYQEITEQARSMEFSGGEMAMRPMYTTDY